MSGREGGGVRGRFEELDWRETPLGELVLRRRWDLTVDQEVHEIKLNDEFLMSSLFTVTEVELARLAMVEVAFPARDVVVGGLGLGYTAQTVLRHPNLRHLVVVDSLREVIEWHERELIPAGAELAGDPRCRLVHGDFFEMARSGAGFDPAAPDRLWHGIIVDIDHSPRHHLHSRHASFYQPESLRRLAGRLHPAGVFALWSNDSPDERFTEALVDSFGRARAETVRFAGPLGDGEATATIYLATTSTAQ